MRKLEYYDFSSLEDLDEFYQEMKGPIITIESLGPGPQRFYRLWHSENEIDPEAGEKKI